MISPASAMVTRSVRAASRRGERARTVIRLLLTYLFLLAFALAMVGPFVLMVSASLQPNMIYLTFPMPLISPNMGLANYVLLFSRSLLGRWVLNSVVITASITTLQIVTCSMSGFAFARGKFVGRDLIFWIFMGTLMIPSTVTIIPLYIVVSTIGWGNTFPGLIIPQATSIFGRFLLSHNLKS